MTRLCSCYCRSSYHAHSGHSGLKIKIFNSNSRYCIMAHARGSDLLTMQVLSSPAHTPTVHHAYPSTSAFPHSAAVDAIRHHNHLQRRPPSVSFPTQTAYLRSHAIAMRSIQHVLSCPVLFRHVTQASHRIAARPPRWCSSSSPIATIKVDRCRLCDVVHRAFIDILVL